MCRKRLRSAVYRRHALSLIATLSLLLPMLAAGASAQLSNIQITDQTSGVHETQGTFNISIMATSDVGISTVRIYLWFEVPEGITQTQIITLDSQGLSIYGTTVDVPQNASTMNYYIAAYDTAASGKNSDVVTRDVRDTFPPVASCKTSDEMDMGESYAFDGSSSTDNVGVASYVWAFNYDGAPVALSGAAPTYNFSLPGTYTGTLTVKDTWDNTDTAAFTLTVLDPEPPVADAGYEMTVYSGNLLFFDGSASTDNHMLANYTWTLQHNDTELRLYGQSPEYIFWTPGDYSVTLTVSDASGNTAVDHVAVHVLKADSEAGIPWWVYALVIMIVLIIVAGLAIIKS